jgi:uncharacterized protein with PIN domain
MSPRPARARFVADAMLGSLSRKLRVLGFDTAYYRSGGDDALLVLASDEGRIILTSDRTLASLARARGVRALLVEGRNDRARIRSIVSAARASGVPLRRGDSLCSVCGATLLPLARSAALGLVPPTVGRRHRLFFRCSACGQVYWRGSHWKKLRSLARLIEEKKNAAVA